MNLLRLGQTQGMMFPPGSPSCLPDDLKSEKWGQIMISANIYFHSYSTPPPAPFVFAGPPIKGLAWKNHINKHTKVISYYYNCLQKRWKVIVSPYQRGEVGGKVAVHTFPNLADCLYLHLKKNHRVLKQSTCNQSLNTALNSFKIHMTNDPW